MVAPDIEVVRFASNFEYLEGEFFLHSALGKGIDSINPNLAFGGPPPIGAQKANLDHVTAKMAEEFGNQEIGQLRAVIEAAGGRGIKRPLLNLSKEVFSDIFDKAIGFKLKPRFDPYSNSINFLLAANLFPYTGLVGLVGATPLLLLPQSRKRANETVHPYNITVAEFTNRTSTLANKLANCGLKDEGIIVPRSLGAENRTESNILAADVYSRSYSRTVRELLRILYASGSESKVGAFFPKGANGLIARSFLIGSNVTKS
ncbi:desiccation-related protein PCC13-62-like [Cucumis melo var. makuwa]|uniref:Desiccation-related protein PCC13-62-like n=1 Tax=Cucumis melo var. makuwa TaxID=1194695 RepID=A0A5A7VQX7_CUCMM|nr:desiccation-related protein PCC13-62-like [Cucumis melo var. makuwa]